ncbi:hypothetical protein C8R44DRAFT_733902 [Mycena epipterygia]|nr:hypothetical protein C8R44DRAFT_733902 [Mycena epipterygia]
MGQLRLSDDALPLHLTPGVGVREERTRNVRVAHAVIAQTEPNDGKRSGGTSDEWRRSNGDRARGADAQTRSTGLESPNQRNVGVGGLTSRAGAEREQSGSRAGAEREQSCMTGRSMADEEQRSMPATTEEPEATPNLPFGQYDGAMDGTESGLRTRTGGQLHVGDEPNDAGCSRSGVRREQSALGRKTCLVVAGTASNAWCANASKPPNAARKQYDGVKVRTQSGGGATAHGLTGWIDPTLMSGCAELRVRHSDSEEHRLSAGESTGDEREGKEWRYTYASTTGPSGPSVPAIRPFSSWNHLKAYEYSTASTRAPLGLQPPPSIIFFDASKFHCAPLLVPAISGDYFCALREFPRRAFWGGKYSSLRAAQGIYLDFKNVFVKASISVLESDLGKFVDTMGGTCSRIEYSNEAQLQKNHFIIERRPAAQLNMLCALLCNKDTNSATHLHAYLDYLFRDNCNKDIYDYDAEENGIDLTLTRRRTGRLVIG